MKVIFIASASHSGSTLLELILCANPGLIGIGEAYQLVNVNNRVIFDIDSKKCACGAELSSCFFWEEIIIELQKNRLKHDVQRYEYVYDNFARIFGKDKVLVDSSKTLRALKQIKQLRNIDLKIIHLVRDVRPWLVSMQETYKRSNLESLGANISKHGVIGILKYLSRTRFVDMHSWYRTNKRLDTFFKIENISFFRVSYEALCLDFSNTLKGLSKFLDMDLTESFPGNNVVNHNILGNRMRFDPVKSKHIMYDYRWFSNKCWMLPAIIFPYITKYNRNICYGESEELVWNK